MNLIMKEERKKSINIIINHDSYLLIKKFIAVTIIKLKV